MKFNSGNDSIIADITFWTKANDTDYPRDPDRTRNCNMALDDICALILQADGKWKWDDTNHTDQPIGKTSLVADRQDYGIAGSTFLKITEVQILNSAGTYDTLTPVTEDSPNGKDLIRKRLSGTPKYYLKKGDSIFLSPIPSSALTNGLRIFFQRDVHYFVVGDTTAEPGFAQPFHRLVPLKASLDYCEANGMNARAATIRKRIEVMELKLMEFYSSRDVDQRIRMELRKEDYGSEHLKVEGGEGAPAADWD